MINCTTIQHDDTTRIYTIIALVLLATYTIGINIIVISLTILWRCPVQRMLLSSQVANIFASTSFFANQIYYSNVSVTSSRACLKGTTFEPYLIVLLILLGRTGF